MEFRLIDFETWPRTEYFKHYFDNIPCTYSMTVKLDITQLQKSKSNASNQSNQPNQTSPTHQTNKIKLYPALLYAVSTVVNRHEEFRTAVDDQGRVGVFSEMMPCYTVFHQDTETFSNIWTEYTSNYAEFCKRYNADQQQYGNNHAMMAKPNPPLNTFPVSMIPWTSFEGFNLNLQKGYGYLLPIFTFGRFYEENGKYLLPLALQVHHAVCDGFHTSRFVNELQAELNQLPQQLLPE